MPTYSKETALYDTGAIAAGLDAAGNTADTYITAVGQDGITVHPARPNWSTTGGRTNINVSGMTVYVGSDDVAFYGATARIGKSNSDRVTVDSTNGITIYKGNSKRLRTTANGVDVYGSDGSTSIASFGSSTRIGKPYVSGASNNESHMELDYHSLRMVDREGGTYFWASDLRDEEGYLTETFDGDGETRRFMVALEVKNSDYPTPYASVLVDGVDTSYTMNGPRELVLANAPVFGAEIVVRYMPRTDAAKAYTLGKRADGKVGPHSVAEGYKTIASGNMSHAEGSSATAKGGMSHAEGYLTYAGGSYSHAEGYITTASGFFSHAQNSNTIAASDSQTAIGKYNANSSANAFEVGNGTSDSARSNAFAVGWDGTVTTARDILVTSTSGMSGIMTAASGITIDIFKFCQRSNVASILLRAKKSTVTAANTAISVGTVVADRRPPFECAGPGTSGVGDCWVDDTGSVKFRSTSQIAANANFYVRVTYPIA